ncbi:DUF3073 domain-containing protein [Acrocarpospora macrocephala]|uniref:DUF3073 domain-containing protein n=2 Tax=Acrocarpospora TaxID=90974 RepID=A0A5M3XY83_9ACTN|nr:MULTISPECIES: DUF3073 family protein [Acrocarpospora]GES06917.1 hypothetical protein Amac_005120 [Acrocarpospora macrocephala]GES23298.1 hypothetical protein Aple_061970 [Acrocarpospora pleiomorpha]
MGRGRAKAKQVKVARELKYRDGGDLESLRRELGVDGAPAANRSDDSETEQYETEQGV